MAEVSLGSPPGGGYATGVAVPAQTDAGLVRTPSQLPPSLPDAAIGGLLRNMGGVDSRQPEPATGFEAMALQADAAGIAATAQPGTPVGPATTVPSQVTGGHAGLAPALAAGVAGPVPPVAEGPPASPNNDQQRKALSTLHDNFDKIRGKNEYVTKAMILDAANGSAGPLQEMGAYFRDHPDAMDSVDVGNKNVTNGPDGNISFHDVRARMIDLHKDNIHVLRGNLEYMESDFATLSRGKNFVTMDSLKEAAMMPDAAPQAKEAYQFFVDNPSAFNALDVADTGKTDKGNGQIGISDVQAMKRTIDEAPFGGKFVNFLLHPFSFLPNLNPFTWLSNKVTEQ